MPVLTHFAVPIGTVVPGHSRTVCPVLAGGKASTSFRGGCQQGAVTGRWGTALKEDGYKVLGSGPCLVGRGLPRFMLSGTTATFRKEE